MSLFSGIDLTRNVEKQDECPIIKEHDDKVITKPESVKNITPVVEQKSSEGTPIKTKRRLPSTEKATIYDIQYE